MLRAHRLGELRRRSTPAAVSTSIQRSVSPQLVGDALGDVAVGREVVAVDHDLGAARPGGDRGAHQLVEQHRGRVADRGLPGRGAEHDPAELVAEGERQVDPALVPAADQPPAPLLVDERREPLGGDRERPAEGVAVEVDQGRVGPDEPVAVGCQRVGGVELVGVRSRASRLERQARAMSTPRPGGTRGPADSPLGVVDSPGAFPTGLVAPRLTGPALAGAGLGGPVMFLGREFTHVSHPYQSRRPPVGARRLGPAEPGHGRHGRQLPSTRPRPARPSSRRPPRVRR